MDGYSEVRRVTAVVDVLEESSPYPVFRDGRLALRNSIRLPVTQAIPMPEWLGQNKVVVETVCLRLTLAVAEETRMMAFLYEPHEEVRKQLDATVLVKEQNVRPEHVPVSFATKRVSFDETGLVSKYGPLMVRKDGSSSILDSSDGTPFESRVTTGVGKPIGDVKRERFEWHGTTHNMRTTHNVKWLWELKEGCVYAPVGWEHRASAGGTEMLLYIDSPATGVNTLDMTSSAAATFSSMVVDIYYYYERGGKGSKA